MADKFDYTYEYGMIADTIQLEMETLEDRFEKAIAVYEYPYADGADLEDMGLKARKIRIKCYFWDDGANHNTYEAHVNLLKKLDTAISGGKLIPLDHPKYGRIYGRIESIAVNHDDQLRTAQADISFIEDKRPNIAPRSFASPKLSIESAYISGQATQVLLAESKIRDTIKNYESKVTALTATVSDYIGIVGAKAAAIAAPVNSLQSTITYASSLAGTIVSGLAANLEKVSLLYSSQQNSPARFLTSINNTFDDLADSFKTFKTANASSSPDNAAIGEILVEHLKITCAQRIALEAANLYDADDAAYHSPSDNPDTQIMNIRELEESLAVARKWIESAVEAAREMDELKVMAGALLEQVNTVRLEREKLKKVIVDPPMPLHLVCLKYGLSVTDAERLLRINRQIENPNFTSGEILVYAG